MVKGFPGSRLFRRRGAEEIAEEEAAGRLRRPPSRAAVAQRLRRVAQRADDVADPLEGLALGQPLQLGRPRRRAPGGRAPPRPGRGRCSGSRPGPASGPARRAPRPRRRPCPPASHRRACRSGRRRCRARPRRPARGRATPRRGSSDRCAPSPGSRARVPRPPAGCASCSAGTSPRTRLRSRSRSVSSVLRGQCVRLVHRRPPALVAADLVLRVVLGGPDRAARGLVSSVISRSTVPSTVDPWLFQVTWSPFANFSVDGCAALPSGAVGHTSPDRERPHPSGQWQGRFRHVASCRRGFDRFPLAERAIRLPSVRFAPVLDRRPGRPHSPGVGRVGPF